MQATCPHCQFVQELPDAEGAAEVQCRHCRRRFRAVAEEPAEVLAADEPVAEVMEVVPAEPPHRPVRHKIQPFVLGPGERILMQGGMAIAAWIWTVVFLCATPLLILMFLGLMIESARRSLWHLPICTAPLFLGLVAVGAFPYLRSGRYWLTNRALHWKPHVGVATALPVEDLAGSQIHVNAQLATLAVRGRRGITLRHIDHLDWIWGGVALLQQTGPFDLPAAGEAPADLAWWNARLTQGVSQQPGYAVLRPGFFGFIPAAGKVNVLAQVAGGLATQALHLPSIHWVERKLPFGLLFEIACPRDPHQIDSWIRDQVRQQDGVLWNREDPDVEVGVHSNALVFKRQNCTIHGAVTSAKRKDADKILAQWPKKRSIPFRQPILLYTGMAAVASVVPLIFLYVMLFHYPQPTPAIAVDETTVFDRNVAPSDSFVSMRGRPDPEHMIYLGRSGDGRDLIVVLKESPRLVVYCREGDALNAALHRYRPDPKKPPNPKAAPEIEKTWTITGRLYDEEEAPTPVTVSVRNRLRKQLDLKPDEELRVLIVTPDLTSEQQTNRVAFPVCGVISGVAAGALWLLVLRALWLTWRVKPVE